MRTANWITVYAGILVVAGYGFGSAVQSAIARHNAGTGSERELEREGGRDNNTSRDLWPVLIGAAGALAWAIFAYRVIDWAAPGTEQFRLFSAVGILAPRALTVWEAVALWAGLGYVCGRIAPFNRGFKLGDNGLAPAGLLLLAFSPFTFFASLFVWFGTQALPPGWRLDRKSGLLVTLFSAAGLEWLQSMVSASVAPRAWGLVHGPETVLWVVVMAGALAARLSHDTLDELPDV